MYQYEAIFRVNLGNVIPEIGDIANGVNTHLAKDGYNEQLTITSESVIPPLVIKSDRELTKEDQHKMKTLLEAEMIKAFPKYDVRLATFGRKSVTSEQAVQ